ncbi:MAG: thioredoxin family protein [Bacteroidaceae bacterium]|nr:thioredoxin family protein [Bacteroidaceae bacterium]
MKKSFLLLFFALTILAACQPKVDRLAVSGNVENGAGQKLYLESVGTTKVSVVDSVLLDSTCRFEFKVVEPAHFDLYRLKSGGKAVTFAVLPGQNVELYAEYPNLNLNYTINGGGPNDTLYNLIKEQIRMEEEISQIIRNSKDSHRNLNSKLQEKFAQNATYVRNNYIYNNPTGPAAYYALFISMNGASLFSPLTNRNDAKTFATVASALDLYYPDDVRSKHLKNVALKAMQATSPVVPASDSVQQYFNSLVRETGIIDVSLPNIDGNISNLSDLKGKVVLLDFTAYKTDYSAAYTLLLRDVYSRFSRKDFEIYQISLDDDEHFWMTAADPLPWIAVHDERGLESQYLNMYRVTALPSAFLIDSESNITERLVATDSLTYKIAALIDRKYGR